MTPASLDTDQPIRTPREAAALEARATRIETPCGDAQAMVWRVWGEGAPVVLLHGGAGSWTHWVRNIAPLVAAGHPVLVPDLPGFGDSARAPAARDADALPPWVERGLVALIGADRCDMVGFSFGGMVAGLLAAQWPARVGRLVLVGAPALIPDPERQLGLKAWRHLPEGPERTAVVAHNLAQLMLAHEATVHDGLALPLHAANLERDRMQRRSLSKTDVLLRTLRAVECPVFGIWGERDALYRGRSDAIGPALAQAPLFQSLALIPDAGHWVQYEAAAAFNAALRDALSTPPVAEA